MNALRNHCLLVALLATGLLVATTGMRAVAAPQPPPNLVGIFNGSYTLDGTMDQKTFRFEFEKQTGRQVKVSVFATDQPDFLGTGKISKDNATLTMTTASTGGKKHRWHLLMTATLLDGGNTIQGTFSLNRPPPLRSDTGTFEVSR